MVVIPGSGRSSREGKGNPLQYSCLDHPMDRGAWWATIHRVSHSWAHTHIHAILCKGLEHPWILVMMGVLEWTPFRYWRIWNRMVNETVEKKWKFQTTYHTQYVYMKLYFSTVYESVHQVGNKTHFFLWVVDKKLERLCSRELRAFTSSDMQSQDILSSGAT